MSQSWASSETARAVMRGNKRRDTLPELRVRQLVHAAGLRYRVDFPPSPEHRRLRADLVFTRLKVAVFIDGCFWHGCPQHYVPSRTNSRYWEEKIKGNAERDLRSAAVLEAAGWEVLRIWSHTPPSEAARLIIDSVRLRAADTQRAGGNPA